MKRAGGPVPARRRGVSWRAILPFAVSAAFLAFLLSRMELSRMAAQWTLRVPAVLVPSLLVYGAATLWIEARTILRVIPGDADFGAWEAARAKAASYLLVIVNYAVGAGTLAVLLRRHTTMSLGAAAGAVFLMALLDLGMLLVVGLAGAVLAGGGDTALSLGSVLLAIGAIVAGFVGLRAPIALGPLERVRRLPLFDAARTAPPRVLLDVALLRLGMVASFIAVSWTSLVAFGLEVPITTAARNFTLVALVGALPFTAAGLGTGQAAFVYLFEGYGSPERLLACSLTLSLGMIALRAGMGAAFAREFTREALAEARSAAAEGAAAETTGGPPEETTAGAMKEARREPTDDAAADEATAGRGGPGDP